MKFALITGIISLFATTYVFAVDTEIEQAKNTVSRGLKDPDSVQFRDIRKVKNSKGIISICGDMNAKNSYGGYVGYTAFSYSQGISTIIAKDSELPDLIDYGASGCGGELKDKIAHNPGLSRESCELSWRQISDVVLFNKTKEQAVDNAISIIKSKNKEVTNESLNQIRQQNMLSLESTINNKFTVEEIKKNTTVFKTNFINQCDAMTRSAMLR